MANFPISALPPATLPLDLPNTFFELQTIEGGIEVSRKIAASNLAIVGTISIEDEGVPLVTEADTLNFVGAGVTASGAGATKTITIPGAGVPDPLTIGRAILTNTNAPDLVDTTVALNVGAVDPDASQHIEIGPIDIQSKSDINSAAALNLNPRGGNVEIGAQDVVASFVQLNQNGLAKLQTVLRGIQVLGADANDPATGGLQRTLITMQNSVGQQVGTLGFGLGATTQFNILNDVQDGLLVLQGTNTALSDTSLFSGDPNGQSQLFQAGVSVARTLVAASGGLEANNTSTGAGFERVLTTSDLGGGGSPFTTPLDIATVGNVAIGGLQDALLRYQRLDATPLAHMGFNGGDQDFEIACFNDSGRVQIFANDSVSAQITGFSFDPDATTIVRGVNAIDLQLGFDVAFRAQTGSFAEMRDNNIATIRTATAALGGALINNTLTGAGLERALTVSDLAAGGGAGISGTPVNNQLAIWVSATDIEGDAELTYDGATLLLDLGSNGTVELTTDSSAGRVVTDGMDGGGDQGFVLKNLDAAAGGGILTIDRTTGRISLQQTNSAGTTLEDLWVNMQRNGAVQLYHNGTQKFDTVVNGVHVFAGSLFMDEIAAAAADVADDGQFWVLDTVPNRSMFTDDSGLDREMIPQIAVMTADDTATSDTTFSAIVGLTAIPLQAAQRYRAHFYGEYNQNVGDIKFVFATSEVLATTSRGRIYAIDESNVVAEINFVHSIGVALTTLTDTEDVVVDFWFDFESNAVTGGTIEVQFAQNTSSANTTTLFESSHLEVTHLGPA